MTRGDERGEGGWRDMRWVDLTALQHFLGALTTLLWLKARRNTIWPEAAQCHKKIICVAALGNVVGNMATNAAYALISSSTAQVVKTCEPIFTFMLSMLLYTTNTTLDLSTFLSIIVIVLGAWSFIKGDSSFNLWGLFAGMIANTAFPIRNIYLKNLSSIWDSPLQKFAMMSSLSFLFLLPLLLIKLFLHHQLPSFAHVDGMVSGVSHCIYNLASITVLESFSPVTHAVLNLSKRAFVIMTNLLYFHDPLTWSVLIGLSVLLVGCYLYQLGHNSKARCIPLKAIIIFTYISR